MFQLNSKLSFHRIVALTTGISLLIMAVAAFFAINLPGEELNLGTKEEIHSVASQLRGNLLAWLIILITDVLVAWGLYVLLEERNRHISLLAAWFRLLYTCILGVGISYLLSTALPLLLETPSDLLAEPDHLGEMIGMASRGFQEVWSFGLIVFGIHLLLLGGVVLQTRIPRFLGILLLLAGLGYCIVHTGGLLSAGFDTYKKTIEMIFMLPMIAGEIGLAIWLLIKGGK
ncbi:MAG: DUF4386 domain-containing protein [Bacteroidota bacterium]